MVVFRWLATRMAFTSVAVLAVACGHGLQSQSDHLASCESTIRSAKAVDAQGDERTALLVELAEEEVALAKNRLKDGEYRRADLLLERAKSDAELALMMTREMIAKTAARKAREALAQETAHRAAARVE